MIKWAFVALEGHRERYEFLQKQITAAKCENQLEFITPNYSDFAETMKDVLQKYEHIRLGSPFGGEMAMDLFKHHTAVMNQLRATDGLIRRHDKWWTESALFDAFCQILSVHGKGLDLNSPALVVGAGAAARTALIALYRAGYKKFKLTNRYDEQSQELIAAMKKTFFAMEIELVPQNQLILLPGESSLLVNTTPYLKSNDLLEELYYLNFLQRNGMIWDLTVMPQKTMLVQEAEQVGVAVVRGIEFVARADVLWADWAFGVKLALPEYIAGLEKIFPESGEAADG